MRKTVVAVLVGLLALGTLGIAGDLGTRGNPIIWVFPPSTEAVAIQDVAQQIVIDIGRATGLYIVTRVMPDYAALIEAFVAAEGNVMGTPTTDQYVRIAEATDFGVSVRLAAVRRGYSYYFGSIYAFRDKGFESIEDLAGKVWIYNDEGSTSGYQIPRDIFEARGITFDGVVKSGGHLNTMISLVTGEGDFGTGFGSPPVPPAGLDVPRWEYGDDPEKWIWDRENDALYPEDQRGMIYDMREMLAGTGRYGEYWDLIEQIGVVDVFGPIPNDCIAFSVGFPEDIQDVIVAAIIEHIRGDGFDLWSSRRFYAWSDVEEIDDSYYDAYREMVGRPVPSR